jgi:hypothetical protein
VVVAVVVLTMMYISMHICDPPKLLLSSYVAVLCVFGHHCREVTVQQHMNVL